MHNTQIGSWKSERNRVCDALVAWYPSLSVNVFVLLIEVWCGHVFLQVSDNADHADLFIRKPLAVPQAPGWSCRWMGMGMAVPKSGVWNTSLLRRPSTMETWRRYFWTLSMNLGRAVPGEVLTATGKKNSGSIGFLGRKWFLGVESAVWFCL